MRATTLPCIVAIVLLTVTWSKQAFSAEGGTAILRVETIPATGPGAVRFAGTPAGQVSLGTDGTVTLQADVAVGRHVSTLEWIDPALRSAGYSLTAVSCNDPASSRRSSGDVSTKRATFEIEDGETVTCTFQLGVELACICPIEGRWNVVNHTGSMACTGAVNMTVPLKASTGQGNLEVNDSCDTIVASGMTEDEADIVMRPNSDCSFSGTVGGSSDGIPMTIEFRWTLENSKRITGDLKSNVTNPGMTCRMSRTYELDYQQ